jgi:Rap1a immunity proteins
MKTTATILLGLMVCTSPVLAEVATTNDLHKQCESKNSVEKAYAYGYIAGVVSTLHFFLPNGSAATGTTEGDIGDAVCKYIDQHPESWSKEKLIGAMDATAALYVPKDAPPSAKKKVK